MDRNETEFIGKIYKYNKGFLQPIYHNIGISNGIAFDSKNNMYHSDSLNGKVYFNGINIKTYEGIGPDGSCVDENDNYYSCLWGGSKIDIFKNQKVIDNISLPVKYPTCCCFGEDKMFITSASILNNSGDNGNCLII